jgi:hypothetical protein
MKSYPTWFYEYCSTQTFFTIGELERLYTNYSAPINILSSVASFHGIQCGATKDGFIEFVNRESRHIIRRGRG